MTPPCFALPFNSPNYSVVNAPLCLSLPNSALILSKAVSSIVKTPPPSVGNTTTGEQGVLVAFSVQGLHCLTQMSDESLSFDTFIKGLGEKEERERERERRGGGGVASTSQSAA